MTTTFSAPFRTLEPQALNPLPPVPLVSILLANYNYARYVGESIESVVNQSYQNWELIVCDDGSTDDSLEVVRAYADRDRRIKVLSKPNGGHTSALNLAYSACRGEVICLLDSDDLYLPSKLEATIRECAQFPQAGLISHAVVRVDEHRKQQGVWPLSALPDGWLGPEVLRVGGVLPYAPPTAGISLRREISDLLFPLSETPPLDMCPDQVIMRLAPLMTRIRRISAALAEYRVHNANAYARQRVTAASVAKQLLISKALWREQHKYLFDIQAGLAAQLADHDESSLTALHQYIGAKLGQEPTVRNYHAKLLQLLKSSGDTKLIPFWAISLYLPNFLFQPAINMLLGQGAVKQFIARLKKLL